MQSVEKKKPKKKANNMISAMETKVSAALNKRRRPRTDDRLPSDTYSNFSRIRTITAFLPFISQEAEDACRHGKELLESIKTQTRRQKLESYTLVYGFSSLKISLIYIIQ